MVFGLLAGRWAVTMLDASESQAQQGIENCTSEVFENNQFSSFTKYENWLFWANRW
jgi:hypothetical protein